MKKCFAKKDDGSCNALDRKTCFKCKFYKPKSEIKNNIFYPYSFTSKRLYKELIERYERKYGVKFRGQAMIKEIKEADKIIDEMNNATDEQIEMLETQAEKVTSIVSDISVQGSRKTHSREDVYILLAEMRAINKEGKDKLDKIYNSIPLENRDLRIYFDKVYYHMSNTNLELKYGLTKRHINRIVKKVRKKHQCPPNVPPIY